MACRTISDLGLHEHAAGDSRAAYYLLGACLVYEGIWCLYVGRPSYLPKSMLDVAAAQRNSKQHSDSPLLNAWVGLCIPMAEVTGILNSPSSAYPERASRLSELSTELSVWLEHLPPNLAYNDATVAEMEIGAYTLHMQYCRVRILLDQALTLSSAGQHPSDNQTQAHRAAAYPNALRMARLALTYKEIFGADKLTSLMLDNIHLAVTYMVQHLLYQNSPDSSFDRDWKWIRSIVRALEAVEPHYPITKRMIGSLENMTDGTRLSNLLLSHSNSVFTETSASNDERTTSGVQLPAVDDFWSVFGLDASSNSMILDSTQLLFPRLNV